MGDGVTENRMRASGLVCLDCGHAHELDVLTYECGRCGWPLGVTYAPDGISSSTAREVLISARHMWDFFDFLPVDRRDAVVDLGVGGTPLLEASAGNDDAKGGKVAVEGWAEVSEMTATDLAKSFEDDGVAAIIHTDIDRDGVLEGVNVAATLAVADAVAIPVIASGGVASVTDIAALKACEGQGIAGAIIGRALYEGTLEPTDALAAAA